MSTNKTLNIADAILMDAYRVALTFDDGKAQTVDFKPFLAASHHPSVRAYLDPERFAQFELRHGELIWGDYDLCFPIMDLYNNTLRHDGEHDRRVDLHAEVAQDTHGQDALDFVERRSRDPARAARLTAMRERLGKALAEQSQREVFDRASSDTVASQV